MKLGQCLQRSVLCLHNLRNSHKNKNSAEVDIAPAFGEITTACNVGQAKKGSWCVLEEWTTSLCKVSYSQPSLLQRNVLNSRLDVNFLDSTQNIDKVSGA